MRFLCLHGLGSSSEVLEWQLAPLRSALGDHYEFEFIGGSLPFPQAPEIHDIFPNDAQYWCYADPYHPETIKPFLQDLAEFIESDGPFDVILGFSHGAQLAATFLVHEQQQRAASQRHLPPSFKCAVFICGFPPWRVDDARVTWMTGENNVEAISIPTLHIYGSSDAAYHYSQELVSICHAHHREELDHGRKHEIPRDSKITVRMASLIKKIVEESVLLQ